MPVGIGFPYDRHFLMPIVTGLFIARLRCRFATQSLAIILMFSILCFSGVVFHQFIGEFLYTTFAYVFRQ